MKKVVITMINKSSLKNYDILDLENKLKACKKIDSNNIDLEKVKDISEVKIDQNKSSIERILDFLSQGFNPYLYRVGDSLVEISYSPVGMSADACIMDVFKDIYK